MTVSAVGVVGVGAIGSAVAQHLLDAGYDVVVNDSDPDAVAPFAEAETRIADTPREAAEATDLSLVVVGDQDQAETVLCGEDGLFEGANSSHVVGIVSTVSPEWCREMAAVAAEEGIEVIDVPVCRGQSAAEDGQLLVLAGGDREAFEAARPVLDQFTGEGDVFHFGRVGTGQVAKTANNTLLWSNLVANYEVLSLADEYGLDLTRLRAALVRSSGDNWPLREWDWQYTTWAHEDLEIAMEMAAEKDVPMPVAGLLSQRIREIGEAELDEVR